MTGAGSAAPTFDIGDFLPRVTFLTAPGLTALGAVLDPTHQTGRCPILLWVAGAKPSMGGATGRFRRPRGIVVIDPTYRLAAVRIGCYDSSSLGAFRLHRDNMTPDTAYRQFALSINLNTGEFEGGGLRFPEFGRATYTPSLGGAGVFACGLLHEVVPVTAGRRFVLLGFLQDAAHFEGQRRMIESRGGESGLKPVVLRA